MPKLPPLVQLEDFKPDIVIKHSQIKLLTKALSIIKQNIKDDREQGLPTKPNGETCWMAYGDTNQDFLVAVLSD